VWRDSGEDFVHRALGAWFRLRHEPLTEPLRCGAVSLRGGLRIDREGETGIGMTEARLGGLDVDPFHHEPGCVEATEIVEAESL
jgi:hypothetical protein